ncbi:hypothetical protein [Pseudovibrio brasiliensis]|uniref:Uncharacterized protein n=1 Tax=Pseudovibrio brasiliensis TaxID=1898042 RepID=A0ABX8AQJ1_9HYPH|nr:hypothetical protein [Pseudovibrio brasiliensis]QUS57374.1 hypothetical protein KGB56_08275 [Pseudovibrio brasiliensis]
MSSSNNPFEATTKVYGNTTSYELTDGLLVPDGGNILIKGTDIKSLTSGFIESIQIVEGGIIYEYQILVRAGAPSSVIDMRFYDESPDSYGLTIGWPFMVFHTVNYNSSDPDIDKIKISITTNYQNPVIEEYIKQNNLR